MPPKQWNCACLTYRCAPIRLNHLTCIFLESGPCCPTLANQRLPTPHRRRYSQRLDHFSRHDKRRWQQRYTLCNAYWNPNAKNQAVYMYLGEAS